MYEAVYKEVTRWFLTQEGHNQTYFSTYTVCLILMTVAMLEKSFRKILWRQDNFKIDSYWQNATIILSTLQL